MSKADLDRLRAKARVTLGGEPEPPPGRFDDNVVPLRASNDGPDTSSDMRDAMTKAFEAMQARISRGGGLAGAESGLECLDYALDGWQRGRFYVIGGRTGMGKTILGANVAMGLAERGNGVDYLSFEMPTEEQAIRCLLSASRVGHWRIRQNLVRPEDWSAMTAAAARVSKLPWMWDDKSGVNVDWIARHIRATRAKLKARGADLHTVVLDTVQKIRGDNARANLREQMVRTVDALKQLAIREDVCMLALAQIGRGTEARNQKDRRPRMADLQEAGAIEQEADGVMLLFRADYYAEKGEERDHVLDVAMPKIRGGEPTYAKLHFDGACYRIDNPTVAP